MYKNCSNCQFFMWFSLQWEVLFHSQHYFSYFHCFGWTYENIHDVEFKHLCEAVIHRFYDEKAKPTIPTHQKQAGFAASKLGVASSGKNKIFVPGEELWYKRILDPSSDFILTWNHIFLFLCFVALFIDPLYFYVPKISYGTPNSCIGTDRHLAITVTFFRSISDLLYFTHIIIKFRTAYINPSSTMRVFGRGDLITDPKEIAWQYLRSDFVVDAVAALPLPQVTWRSSFYSCQLEYNQY